MPDISDLQAGHEFESFRPVGAGVAGNRGFGVPLGAVLHVAGLGGPAAIQPRSVPPFRVALDAVGRIRDQQDRLALAQQPSNSLRLR